MNSVPKKYLTTQYVLLPMLTLIVYFSFHEVTVPEAMWLQAAILGTRSGRPGHGSAAAVGFPGAALHIEPAYSRCCAECVDSAVHPEVYG